MYNGIQKDYDCMTLTLPDDKKDFVKKEVKAVSEKLEVVGRFKEKVDVIDDYVSQLNNFDVTLKTIDKWMKEADANLDEIRNHSHKLTPEDRAPAQWSFKKMLQRRLKLSIKQLPVRKTFCPKETKSPKMPKTSKLK